MELFSPWLAAQQFGEGRGGVGSKHQACADEERIEPSGAQFRKFSRSANAGFADSNALVGNLFDQFKGRFDTDIERFQVAIVDADNS